MTYDRPLSDFFSDELAKKTGLLEKKGGANPLVTGLEYDSRNVKPRNLFFALSGLHTDGHKYINSAIQKGAAVIIHGDAVDEYQKDIVYLRVKDSRFAMSAIADAFYGSPSKRLSVIGVTGTEGKSTTVYLIFQLLKQLNQKTGFISTVQYSVDGSEQWNVEHQTTPEATTIHQYLAKMVSNGVKYAVIESSSHGLSTLTNRLGDVLFDTGVMTNVTHEHLEFHGTWEQYRSDKANLFRALQNFGVLNADDKSAEYFIACTNRKCFTHSVKGADADMSIVNLQSYSGGNRYDVKYRLTGKTIHIEDNLPGAFNAGNVLSSLLVVSNLLDIPVEEMLPLVKKLKPVRGRMTSVQKGQPFEVLVDYAHTPSSFETIFPPLRERLGKSGGRIITLFGSAGERDTKKRSEQGRIAALYSDIIVLADEDPRGEVPMAILEEIAAGINGFERGKNLFLIPDRPAAIRKAFSLAAKGDLVLLLGKGHENSIIYADKTIKYDEIAEAEQALGG
jgi:UDP-N-acetylmuramoyl-L-alanyl-D-glutamate--2,6-diaminopimelate ligase